MVERGPPMPVCEPWVGAGPGRWFTREAIRSLDRLAFEEFGIPGIVLMENAAIRVAEFAAGVLAPGRGVVVVCGPGNNGGDGLAAARQLANVGIPVAVVLGTPREKARGDAATNLRIAERMGLAMFDAVGAAPGAAVDRAIESLGAAGAGMVIDALLGTGVDKPAREPVRGLIERVNETGRGGVGVLSVDLPSGMDADTGLPAGGGAAVRARWTVTLVGKKAGFRAEGAREYLGEVSVADIGVPRVLVERVGTE